MKNTPSELNFSVGISIFCEAEAIGGAEAVIDWLGVESDEDLTIV